MVQTLRVSAQQNQISPSCRVMPWTSGAGTSISAVTAPLSGSSRWILHNCVSAHHRPPLVTNMPWGRDAGRGNRAPDLHRGRVDQVEPLCGRHGGPHGPVVQPLQPVSAGHVGTPRVAESDDALAGRVVVFDRAGRPRPACRCARCKSRATQTCPPPSVTPLDLSVSVGSRASTEPSS